MEVTFLGVGEAFDERHSNTSVLVSAGPQARPLTLLLDCGYSAPPSFWRQELHAEALDGVWISHFHADHAFGLPALLVRLWEEGRRRALHILGQEGIKSFALNCLDLAYPGFYFRLKYPLHFTEVEPTEPLTALGLSWATAINDHPQRNLALRLESAGKSLFYSGDGKPTPETRELAHDAHLIIHEAFRLSEQVPGHGTVFGCLEMARSCRARRLSLVHIQRQVRKERLGEIRELASSVKELELLVPEPGQRLKL